MRYRKLPLLPIFIVGIFLGLIASYLGRDLLRMPDMEKLQMSYRLSMDRDLYFCYLFILRLRPALLCIVLATTYLGMLVCAGWAVWYGVVTGICIGTYVIDGGMQGLLLFGRQVLPQFLFYFFASMLLLTWCESLCRKIYYQKEIRIEKGFLFHADTLRFCVRLLVVFVLILIGCIVECVCMPYS